MWRILSALGLHLVGPRVMLGVLLAAIAGLTISLWEIDRLRTQAHDAEAALADATQSINDQRAEIKRMDDLLDVRKAQIRKSHARLDAAHKRLKALEDTDADAKAWAGQPVPDGIREWLRNPDGGQ